MMKKERNKQKKMGKGEERKKCWQHFRSPFVVYLFFFFIQIVGQAIISLVADETEEKKREEGGRVKKTCTLGIELDQIVTLLLFFSLQM